MPVGTTTRTRERPSSPVATETSEHSALRYDCQKRKVGAKAPTFLRLWRTEQAGRPTLLLAAETRKRWVRSTSQHHVSREKLDRGFAHSVSARLTDVPATDPVAMTRRRAVLSSASWPSRGLGARPPAVGSLQERRTGAVGVGIASINAALEPAYRGHVDSAAGSTPEAA